ncbi:MAG: phage tail tip lysozyme [Evtepia sp.]|uniref:phage tail tip lysozyme n=1 Tax=Evtepia sp. TaxID=2773933 RepID=UPI002A75F4B1|nr:phage tail tip lysozyme [Evtepia sp.]MDY3013659.1 phage tail tip lysozyme [Evtepia sp.]
MKKRVISMVMALCLAVSLLPGALAAGTYPFGDVPASHWAREEIQYVYDAGLMDGMENDQFLPEGTITRAMIVTILYRMAGEPAVTGSSGFQDVAKGTWYAQPVTWASANGIVKGYDGNLFKPNEAISREQMATFLYRYAQFQGYNTSDEGNLSGYTDVWTISDYAFQAMSWANAEGIITGMTSTTLVPKGTATRAQAAVIFYRFCETVVPEGGVTIPMMIRNLENSKLPKKDTLTAMAQVMLDDGFEPAFVAGALGNIQEEGACGIFESSAYIANPEMEPDYLRYMDEHYDYRNLYSGQYIYDGFSVASVYDMICELGPGGANGRGSCFGLGCMQWTSYNRIKNLVENYLEVAGSSAAITKEQVQKAEGMTISEEFRGSYKKVYTNWKSENPDLYTTDAAFAAGVKICTSYGIPVGYDTPEVQGKRGNNAVNIYNVMMGEA